MYSTNATTGIGNTQHIPAVVRNPLTGVGFPRRDRYTPYPKQPRTDSRNAMPAATPMKTNTGDGSALPNTTTTTTTTVVRSFSAPTTGSKNSLEPAPRAEVHTERAAMQSPRVSDGCLILDGREPGENFCKYAKISHMDRWLAKRMRFLIRCGEDTFEHLVRGDNTGLGNIIDEDSEAPYVDPEEQEDRFFQWIDDYAVPFTPSMRAGIVATISLTFA